jgi:hypothetical protein
MIVELLLVALMGTVEFVLSLLPVDPVTWPEAEAFGVWAGALVGPLNSLLPMAEFVAVLTLTVSVVLPAIIVYRLAMWLWGLLPIPGSG